MDQQCPSMGLPLNIPFSLSHLLTCSHNPRVRSPGFQKVVPQPSRGEDKGNGGEWRDNEGDIGKPGVVDPAFGAHVDAQGQEIHQSLVKGEHRDAIDSDVEEGEETKLDQVVDISLKSRPNAPYYQSWHAQPNHSPRASEGALETANLGSPTHQAGMEHAPLEAQKPVQGN